MAAILGVASGRGSRFKKMIVGICHTSLCEGEYCLGTHLIDKNSLQSDAFTCNPRTVDALMPSL